MTLSSNDKTEVVFSSIPGQGVIYSVIVRDPVLNTSSSYIPVHTYACSFSSTLDGCDTLGKWDNQHWVKRVFLQGNVSQYISIIETFLKISEYSCLNSRGLIQWDLLFSGRRASCHSTQKTFTVLQSFWLRPWGLFPWKSYRMHLEGQHAFKTREDQHQSPGNMLSADFSLYFD